MKKLKKEKPPISTHEHIILMVFSVPVGVLICKYKFDDNEVLILRFLNQWLILLIGLLFVFILSQFIKSKLLDKITYILVAGCACIGFSCIYYVKYFIKG